MRHNLIKKKSSYTLVKIKIFSVEPMSSVILVQHNYNQQRRLQSTTMAMDLTVESMHSIVECSFPWPLFRRNLTIKPQFCLKKIDENRNLDSFFILYSIESVGCNAICNIRHTR